MVLAAGSLVGWWVGFAVGGAAVLLVVVLLVLIIVTAHRIAAVVEDATRSLEQARDRTEVLWQVKETNKTATDILDGAVEARRLLGGAP